MACVNRLINISIGLNTVCVIGCGPNPSSVIELLKMGFDVVGIEPVPGSAEAASLFLGNKNKSSTLQQRNFFCPTIRNALYC